MEQVRIWGRQGQLEFPEFGYVDLLCMGVPVVSIGVLL